MEGATGKIYFLRTAQRIAAPPTARIRTRETTSRFRYRERLVFSAACRSSKVDPVPRGALSAIPWRAGGDHSVKHKRKARSTLLMRVIYITFSEGRIDIGDLEKIRGGGAR
jgi:hypothetical protein